MIALEEATDLWLKVIGAGSVTLTVLAGCLVWIVKKQATRSGVETKALIDSLKANNTTLANHLESEAAMRERHHAENRAQAAQLHREREERALDQHEEIMLELLRGRDRDHDFRTVQDRLVAAVARNKTTTEDEFHEMLAAIRSIDSVQGLSSPSSAEMWREKNRQKREAAERERIDRARESRD